MTKFRYAVSFEIKSDSTYDERYQSLMDEIEAAGEDLWAETTSFILVGSNEDIAAFADRLYYGSKILDTKDMLLVIDHAASAAIGRGPIKYPHTLGSHFKGFDKK